LNTSNHQYTELISSISNLLQDAKKRIASSVNVEIVKAYWHIGKYIVEFEQNGFDKALYGSKLLTNLSKDLSVSLGKGFSRSNLNYMRAFYVAYRNCETLSHKLTWSHFVELLKIDDPKARSFYEKQSDYENWSVRELKRNKNSGLYHRLAVSKDKEEVLKLSKEGLIPNKPEDLIKNPHVFEFLGIKSNQLNKESDLEKALIENLHSFLLELGKGFAFVGRQERITLNNRHFYVDLVFYHIILKCYVLIDLKLGSVEHEHLGQMKLYLGYYEKEVNLENDNQPIGIILAEEKDEIMVEYAMLHDSANVLVSKYQLYLPDIDELKRKIEEITEK
jgi:predicted nuclease of restriction endonuclease-like (RecB) superfamily